MSRDFARMEWGLLLTEDRPSQTLQSPQVHHLLAMIVGFVTYSKMADCVTLGTDLAMLWSEFSKFLIL